MHFNEYTHKSGTDSTLKMISHGDNNNQSTNLKLDISYTNPEQTFEPKHSLSTESLQKIKFRDRRVPSFLQKLNPFTSPGTVKRDHIIPKTHHSSNVQALKQFWIDAFGTGNKWDKSDYSKYAKVKEKSATLGALRTTTSDLSIKPIGNSLEPASAKKETCISETTNGAIECSSSVTASVDLSASVLRKHNLKRKDRSKSLTYVPCVRPSDRSDPHSRRTIKSDNFYKYKTASSCLTSLSKTRDSLVVNCPSVQTDTSGKLNWARRNDIVVSAAAAANKCNPATKNAMFHTDTNATDKVHNSNSPAAIRKQRATVCGETATTNDMTVDSNIPDMVDFIKMPEQSFSDNSKTANTSSCTKQLADDATITKSAIATSESRNSVASDTGGSPRKLGRNTSGTRKYSFKTNKANFQRHSKKMLVASAAGVNAFNAGKVSATGFAGISGRVALLADRFNQVIQQDKGLLAEVSSDRKQIILQPRNSSHIFKIKEETDGGMRKRPLKKTESNDSAGSGPKGTKRVVSIKRRGSTKGIRNLVTTKNGSHVQAAINQFEPNRVDQNRPTVSDSKPNTTWTEIAPPTIDSHIGKPKPIVPAKSAQVLLRTKEIALRNLRNSKINAKPIGSSSPSKFVSIPPVKTIKTEKEVLGTIGETEEMSEMTSISNIVAVTSENTAAQDHKLSNETKYSHLYAKILSQPSSLFPDRRPSKISANPDEMNIPEEKIIEAIHSVNERIAKLTKTRSAGCLDSDRVVPSDDNANVELTNNMNIKPNVSFLFRPNTQDIFGSYGSLQPKTDLSNETVDTKKSMLKTQSMDEIRTKRLSIAPMENINDNEMLEDVAYEVIKPRENTPGHTTDDLSQTTNTTENEETASSSIYQSISEVKSLQNAAVDCESLNSYESFENYETVDEDDDVDRLNVRGAKGRADSENGYEICDPPPPPPPRRNFAGSRGPTIEPPLPAANLRNKTSNGKPVVSYEKLGELLYYQGHVARQLEYSVSVTIIYLFKSSF